MMIAGLGDVAQDVSTIVGYLPTILEAAPTIVELVQDPYFTEIVCRVGQLKDVEDQQQPSPCSITPPGSSSDLGLRNVTYALRAYVFAEQNRWVYFVAPLVLFGLPLAIGYRMGRNRT